MRTVTIQVRVMDEFGQPVRNAHVFTSKTNGATTNSNGYASLTGDAYATVTVSHVGKKPVQYTLQSTPTSVVLKEDYNSLDEVVITGSKSPGIKPDASMPNYLVPAIGGLALLAILMSASGSKPQNVTL